MLCWGFGIVLEAVVTVVEIGGGGGGCGGRKDAVIGGISVSVSPEFVTPTVTVTVAAVGNGDDTILMDRLSFEDDEEPVVSCDGVCFVTQSRQKVNPAQFQLGN